MYTKSCGQWLVDKCSQFADNHQLQTSHLLLLLEISCLIPHPTHTLHSVAMEPQLAAHDEHLSRLLRVWGLSAVSVCLHVCCRCSWAERGLKGKAWARWTQQNKVYLPWLHNRTCSAMPTWVNLYHYQCHETMHKWPEKPTMRSCQLLEAHIKPVLLVHANLAHLVNHADQGSSRTFSNCLHGFAVKWLNWSSSIIYVHCTYIMDRF